jgi:hypothetical protein
MVNDEKNQQRVIMKSASVEIEINNIFDFLDEETKKEAPVVDETGKNKAKGGKNLFDHLKAITSIQDPEYFKRLSEADKKTWSTYMLNRYLSMSEDYLEIINELQKYTLGIPLTPETVYNLYSNIFPKSNIFLKYVKGQNFYSYNKELLNIMVEHFKLSKSELTDYLDICFNTDEGKEYLTNIIKKYGIDEKEIKKLLKREK